MAATAATAHAPTATFAPPPLGIASVKVRASDGPTVRASIPSIAAPGLLYLPPNSSPEARIKSGDRWRQSLAVRPALGGEAANGQLVASCEPNTSHMT